jgi:hypothetical protein
MHGSQVGEGVRSAIAKPDDVVGARQMPQNKEPPQRRISAACERTAAALR